MDIFLHHILLFTLSLSLSLPPLSLSLSHTHRERERERDDIFDVLRWSFLSYSKSVEMVTTLILLMSFVRKIQVVVVVELFSLDVSHTCDNLWLREDSVRKQITHTLVWIGFKPRTRGFAVQCTNNCAIRASRKIQVACQLMDLN